MSFADSSSSRPAAVHTSHRPPPKHPPNRDRGGDGKLSERELERALESLGFTGQPEYVRQLFREIDDDGSGKIGLHELSAWLHKASAASADLEATRSAEDAGVPARRKAPQPPKPSKQPARQGTGAGADASADAGADADEDAPSLEGAAAEAGAPETSHSLAAASKASAAAAAASTVVVVAAAGPAGSPESGPGSRPASGGSRRARSPKSEGSPAVSTRTVSASRPTLMQRVPTMASEDFGGRPRPVRSPRTDRPVHRPAPALRRPAGYAKYAACPFAMVELVPGFGFAHNGMASLLFDKSKVRARFLDGFNGTPGGTPGGTSGGTPGASGAAEGGGAPQRHRGQRQSQKAAEMLVRHHAMDFNVADANADNALDYGEFTRLVRDRMGRGEDGKGLAAATIKGWFDALDTDGSGHISMGEFFVFALQESLERSGAEGGLLGFFNKWDADLNNVLTRAEVQRMASRLGFGDVVTKLLAEFDDNGSDAITYPELVDAIRNSGKANKRRNQFQNQYTNAQLEREREPAAPASASPLLAAPVNAALASAAAGADEATALSALKAWLLENSPQLVSVFRLFDIDGDGDVNRSELVKAIRLLGYQASEDVVSDLFDELLPPPDPRLTS